MLRCSMQLLLIFLAHGLGRLHALLVQPCLHSARLRRKAWLGTYYDPLRRLKLMLLGGALL
jgi:hypothetical protein